MRIKFQFMKPGELGGDKLFKLDFKIELSDILLILGVALMALGIYFIFMPAAIIFLGISFITLAFLMTPKKKGGEK